MNWSEQDCLDLRKARELLENVSTGIRILETLGLPVQKGIEKLPDGLQKKVVKVTNDALHKTIEIALKTLDKTETNIPSQDTLHKLLAVLFGALGGAAGFTGLAVELPITTILIMRSILDIARSEGEDLADPNVLIEAIEVFALGGNSNRDDEAEISYYTIRTALAASVQEASAYLISNATIDESAPVILRFIQKIAERYSIQVSEKYIAQVLPIAGGVGGAAINHTFINHFQKIARGHFIIRRLEKKYGADSVRKMYLNGC